MVGDGVGDDIPLGPKLHIVRGTVVDGGHGSARQSRVVVPSAEGVARAGGIVEGDGATLHGVAVLVGLECAVVRVVGDGVGNGSVFNESEGYVVAVHGVGVTAEGGAVGGKDGEVACGGVAGERQREALAVVGLAVIDEAVF